MLPADPTTLLTLALIVALAPMLIVAFRRSAMAGLVAVSVLVLLSGEEGATLGLNLFGVRILPSQMVALLLLAAALVRLPRSRLYLTPLARLTLTILWLACLASLARGFGVYGAGAGDDARVFFDFLAVATYFATWEWDAARLRTLGAVWVRLALVLTVLATYHVATRGLGDANTLIETRGGQVVTSRALWSAQAFVVGQAFIIVLWHRLERGRRWSFLPLVWFGAWIVLLQHRSVWVAVVAAIAVLAVLNRRPSRTTLLLVGAAVVLLFGTLVTTGQLASITGRLSSTVATASTHEGTFGDRLSGWRFLIDETRSKGSYAVALGEPFGTSYTHTVGVIRVNLQPHNYFVQGFLRLGLAGAVALVTFVLTPLRHRRSTEDDAYFPWPVRAALTVALALYLCTYPASAFQPALLVPLISLARAPTVPERRPVQVSRDFAMAAS